MTKQFYIKLFLLILFFSLLSGSLLAQTHVLMGSSSPRDISVGDYVFYDSGGEGGNYGNNEYSTMIFTSAPGTVIRVTFSDFKIQDRKNKWWQPDYLQAYDGYGTSATVLGKYYGSNNPGVITSTGNSITFYFESNWKDNYSGWKARIKVLNENEAYCVPSVQNYDDLGNEYISNVSIGDINKSSGSNGYSDYTDQSTDIILGQSYTLTISNGNSYPDDDCKAWIDWNQDGDFEDVNEDVTMSGGPDVYTGTVIPPEGASTGTTVMRARIHYFTLDDVCDNSDWGEIEDYTLNVVNNTVPTISGFAPEEACVGGEITIRGNNFLEVNSVSVNGVPASHTIDNENRITITVPNTTTGVIKLATNGGDEVETGSALTIKSPPNLSANIIDDDCSVGNAGEIDLTVDAGISASLDFTGTNEPVDLGDNFLSGRGEFTLEGWVKFTTSMSTGQHSFFGQNNVIEFGFENGDLTCWTATSSNVKYTINNYPDDDEWHHVAAVGTGSSLKLYIDGVEKISKNHTSTTSYGSSNYSVMLGAGVWDNTRTNDPFEGEISVVRFWEIARTEDQISDGRFVKMTGSEPGLLAAYRLDEAVGTTLDGVGSLPPPTINFSNAIQWSTYPSPYTYNWTKQGDGSFSATTEDITNLSAGTYNVTVSVEGCSTSDSYVVEGDDIAPTAKCKDITIQLDASGNVTINAADINNGSTDNCSAQEALVLTIDKSTFDCTNMGANVVTITVEDQAGNQSTCTATVTVEDKEAPVLLLLSDLSIEDCAENEISQVRTFSGISLPIGKYSDNCSTTFTVQYRIQLPDASFANDYGSAATGASVSDPSGFEFPEGVSTIFFRVIDESGNVSNIESYTITIKHKPNPSEITF